LSPRTIARRINSTAGVIASNLMGDHSQIVQRIRLLRLPDEDLPVKPLGLLQPPGLVVPQCQIEGLLDREFGHMQSTGNIRCGLLL